MPEGRATLFPPCPHGTLNALCFHHHHSSQLWTPASLLEHSLCRISALTGHNSHMINTHQRLNFRSLLGHLFSYPCSSIFSPLLHPCLLPTFHPFLPSEDSRPHSLTPALLVQMLSTAPFPLLVEILSSSQLTNHPPDLPQPSAAFPLKSPSVIMITIMTITSKYQNASQAHYDFHKCVHFCNLPHTIWKDKKLKCTQVKYLKARRLVNNRASI